MKSIYIYKNCNWSLLFALNYTFKLELPSTEYINGRTLTVNNLENIINYMITYVSIYFSSYNLIYEQECKILLITWNLEHLKGNYDLKSVWWNNCRCIIKNIVFCN